MTPNYNVFRNTTTYKVPKTGKHKILYRLQKNGEFAFRNGNKIPRSANAASRIKLNNFVKAGGVLLNVAGLGMTIWQGVEEYEETGEVSNETITDGVFGVIAFIPGPGWIISGGYFLFKFINSGTESPIIYDNNGDLCPNDATSVQMNIHIYVQPPK